MCFSCEILIFSNSLPFSLMMHGLPNCQKPLSHRRTLPPTRLPCCRRHQPALKQFCCPRSAAALLPAMLPLCCPPRFRRHAAAAVATLPPLPLPSPRCRRLRHCAAIVLLLLPPPPRCCRRRCQHCLCIHCRHHRCHRRHCRCRFLS